MRKQAQIFKEGDIITKRRNGFRRMIRHAEYQERSGVLKVMYSYFDEELDDTFNATGRFSQFRIGYCSQDNLVRWREQ